MRPSHDGFGMSCCRVATLFGKFTELPRPLSACAGRRALPRQCRCSRPASRRRVACSYAATGADLPHVLLLLLLLDWIAISRYRSSCQLAA